MVVTNSRSILPPFLFAVFSATVLLRLQKLITWANSECSALQAKILEDTTTSQAMDVQDYSSNVCAGIQGTSK